jgi:hypothetical protein
MLLKQTQSLIELYLNTKSNFLIIKTSEMKNSILIIALAVASYALLHSKNKSGIDRNLITALPATDYISTQPLCVAFLQDVSGSITTHGVEIISSSVFNPYYDLVHQNVELHFGLISDSSSHSLLCLLLPAVRINKPVPKDVTSLPITEKSGAKKKYVHELKKYIADSVQFYKDRKRKFDSFCHSVDLMLSKYKTVSSLPAKKAETVLPRKTDLTTVVTIADKVFNQPFFDGMRNFLLLNTDGLDSRKRQANRLANPADVVVINAYNDDSSCLNSITTLKVQSAEQAISFTIHNIQ